MRTKLIRLRVNGERLRFVKGTPPITSQEHIEDWKCPKCFKPTRKAKCIVSHIQFGFEWDDHVDYWRCKCGCTYYTPYTVWLVEREGENA